ncbi:hypothetical protein CMO86_09745 [Candidatus Woesearchaeota archaeon]|nr:hypothetical protein [Candidatus Woesearchaeota archaeon]
MSEKMFKAGQALTKAYKKFDDFANKGLITTLKQKFKGKTPMSTGNVLSKSKALTVFDPKKALPSKLPSAAKKVGKLGKLGKVARIARAATPIALGIEGASLAYKVATLSPEKKAKVKKLKTKLSKVSTKDYHADLMKMSTGGDTMLKNPKKADLDKDGKLSSYEKKRGKAIESNMMKASKGKDVDIDLIEKIVKQPIIGSGPRTKKEIKKKSMGGEMRGYGAARTSGMGLQDEQLVPGKSLDYYKDLM